MKRFSIVVCVLAIGVLAGCGDKETKTVTQTQAPPATTSTPTTSTTPASGDAMGQVPESMSQGGQFDATNEQVLREIESKVVTAASANGLRHVVAHCTAESPSRVRCTVRGTASNGGQGDETDVIDIDQQTGELTLVSQE